MTETPKPTDAYLEQMLDKAGRNKLTGSEALELQRKLEAEQTHDGVRAPITLASPSDIAPVAYVLHIYTHRCLACNTISKHTDVYALNHLKPTWGKGKHVQHMVPVKRLEWNVPVQTHYLTQRETPCCSECLDATREFVTSLPKPPELYSISKLVPQPAGEATEGRSAPDGRKKFGIDDLMA